MKKIFSIILLIILGTSIGYSRYNPKYDRKITEEDLQNFVKEAVAYAKIYGKQDACNEFKDKDGLFNRGELYIYAYDFNGICLSHGSNPNLIGKDLSQLKDPNGIRIIYEMIKILQRDGAGWLKFYWFHPINKRITPKLGYFEKVDSTWWLGSGIYIESNN